MENVKTGLSGTYLAFTFKWFKNLYLAEFAFRHNCLFDQMYLLHRLPMPRIVSSTQKEYMFKPA